MIAILTDNILHFVERTENPFVTVPIPAGTKKNKSRLMRDLFDFAKSLNYHNKSFAKFANSLRSPFSKVI